MRRVLVAVVLVATACGSAGQPEAPPAATTTGIGIPPEGSLYHGVHPGGRTGWEDDIGPTDLAAYEAAAGREAAWVYVSHNWFRSRAFPIDEATWIREEGALPFIRLMFRSASGSLPDRPFRLWRILDGQFDRDLRAWGAAAADFGTPLLVEFGTEVNGDWFGWNGRWNGGADGGPGRFRRAYRHVESVVEGAGAHNITWVFHVNAQSWPRRPWNEIADYYPGDRWVDWVGLSSYGALTPLDDAGDWEPFRTALDRVVPELSEVAPGKPIFVLELGMTDRNPHGSATAFADAALDDLLGGRWPEVRGFSWWNETWSNDDDPAHDTDMRVQTVPGLAEVFQDHLVGAGNVITDPLT